jgi:glucosamine--fructose-6-phosphate aminotransferase (isomerizing)
MNGSHMLAEIRQQPAALARTLESELEKIYELQRMFDRRRPRMILLVARGTSDNAAQFGKYLFEIANSIPVSLAAPSVFTLYHGNLDFEDVLVIGISQSGESTDTNAVLQQAREQGAVTIGITNESASAMSSIAKHVLCVRAGREESVAATKTYTCQMLALYLIAYALGGDIELDDLRRVPECVEGALRLDATVREIAVEYRAMKFAIAVGRGLNYANALEFGLKLMETCYVVTERFSSADLMHGPIALIEPQFPVFVFASRGPTWPALSGVLARLRELDADTVVFTDHNGSAPQLAGFRCIRLPHPPVSNGPEDLYTPIPYVIPAQLFAAHLAAAKGLDPDKPRTLNKITRTI